MTDTVNISFIKDYYKWEQWGDVNIQLCEKKLEEIEAMLETDTAPYISRQYLCMTGDAFDSFINYLLCDVTDPDALIPDVIPLAIYVPHDTIN